ncbi:MAG: TonB-dependent receptor plug domain-containing protein [Gemmatimonadaceae bacterium]
MKRKIAGAIVSAVVILSPLASTAAAAQVARDTARLNPVVVTATRTPVPQVAAPASVTVIEGDDLRERGITNVAEALRGVPGMAIASGGSAGALTSLFLRGGESDFVKVLVDGVAANDPGGALDFAHLSTDNVERIEIVRGPASVLYGSDAVTGVIQVFTREGGSTRSLINADIAGGSFGTLHYGGSVGGTVQKLGYMLSGARNTTDGILPFNNEYANTTLGGVLAFRPEQETELKVSLRRSDAEFHYPTNSSGAPEDSNAFRTERRLTVAAEAGRAFSPRLEARVRMGYTGIDGRSEDQPDNSADTLGFYGYSASSSVVRQSAETWVNTRLGKSLVLTTGAEYTRQRDRNANISLSEFGDFPSEPFHRTRQNSALFGQGAFRARAVAITVGGRFDDNQRFGTFGTYRVGATMPLGRRWLLRAAFGNAFKEPTFFEQFATGFVEGNPQLEPEHSKSWDIGLRLNPLGDRIMAEVTYFDQTFRDLIQYIPTPVGSPDYMNVAASEAAGVEVSLRIAAASHMDVVTSYTYLDGQIREAGSDPASPGTLLDGKRPLRRPAHLAGLTATYSRRDHSSLSVSASYSGKRTDLRFTEAGSTRVDLPAYARIDFSAVAPVLTARGSRPAAALTLRVENALNKRYEDVVGFRTPGRTLLVGLRLEKRLGTRE